MAMTLAELREAVRSQSDMQNSEFVSESELDLFINNSYSELRDLLIKTNEDYFCTEVFFTLTANAPNYDLPEDFYKLRGIDLQWNSAGSQADTRWVPITRFNFQERHKYNNTPYQNVAFNRIPVVQYKVLGAKILFEPASNAPGYYRMYYITQFEPLVDPTDELEVNCNIWNQYIIVDASIKCLTKEESDVRVLQDMKAALIERIKSTAINRDSANTGRISDQDSEGWLWGFGWGRRGY